MTEEVVHGGGRRSPVSIVALNTAAREKVLLAIVFVAFCAVAITGAVTHEPWWDEGQAWLLARDVPTGELLTRVLRYEGHAPLWYLLLKIPASLGLPYCSIKVVALLAAAITVFLLLYAFPHVPLYVRVLAPFTLFIAYQYTVIARSYVLIGPFLLGIAAMYHRRSERPARFTALLVGLSHVSLHGLAIAGGLAAVFAIELLLKRVPRPPRRTVIAAAAVLVANTVVLVLILWPARDNISHINLGSPFSADRYTKLATDIVPEFFWGPPEYESPVKAVLTTLAALSALAVLVFWLARRGSLGIILLPLAGVMVVAARYYNMWHEGILFMLLLFGVLLAYRRPSGGRVLEILGQTVLVLLLLRSAQWTFQSLAFDVPLNYTGSADAARFIREHALDRKKIYAAGIATVELQPYFERNLFANWMHPGAYWEWSSAANPWPYGRKTEEDRARELRWIQGVLAERPDVIVHGMGLSEEDLGKTIRADPAYRRIASFRGVTFWKTRPTWPIGFDVYERRPDAAVPPGASPPPPAITR
jgi:hypothetical protein